MLKKTISEDDTRPRRAACWPSTLLVFLLLSGSNGAAQSARSGPGEGMQELISSRMISARDKPRVHALQTARGGANWEIELSIGNTQALDLDLAVFTEDPEKNPFARPRCVSESNQDVERCRVLGTGSAPLWVRVTVAGGEGSSLYAIWGKPLMGAVLAETELTASDAKPLGLSVSHTGQFVYTEPPALQTFQHAYALRLPPEAQTQALLISCSGTEADATTMLTIFDGKGTRIGQSGPNTTHQLRVDSPSGNSLYVLVQLTPTRSIFSKPRYDLLVAPSSESIPLRLRAESLVFSDDRPRTYMMDLEGFNLAVIVLEGRQYELQVTDASGTKYPVRDISGGQVVRIGAALESSPFVFKALPKSPGKLLVEVRRRTGAGEGYRKDWTLRVLNPLKSEKYMVSFPLEDAEPWVEWTQPKKGHVADGGQKVYALGPFPTARVGSSLEQSSPLPRALTAFLLGPGKEELNFAVCNRYGMVLSIGSSSLNWELPREATDFYLIIFPTPWNARQGGGDYEVRLTVGRPSSSLK